MHSVEADLAAYYDQEADARRSRELLPRRVRSRSGFAGLLGREGRSALLEVGTGPGVDAAWFRAAGFQVSGVDLSPVSVECCRQAGIDAQVASVLDLPFASQSFDGVWSMSTLLHVPDADIDRAVAEMVRVCRPGSPVAVGVWAGKDTEGISEVDVIQPPRFFSFRSRERWAEVLGAQVQIKDYQVWPPEGSAGLVYHWVLARTPPSVT